LKAFVEVIKLKKFGFGPLEHPGKPWENPHFEKIGPKILGQGGF